LSEVIGLLHPGAMGATVGAAAVSAGTRVVWASGGRSDATRARAEGSGLEDVGSLAALVEEASVVLSVCPPATARKLAVEVAAMGFGGVFIDANAVSPDTARDIAAVVERGGGRAVDGGIIGPPARQAGSTTLHLSGPGAADVAALFAGSVLEADVLDAPVGAASALKVAFAAWTKGQVALLAAIGAFAEAEGVGADLRRVWDERLPDAGGRLVHGVPALAAKAWRWVGEMEEIASAFHAQGLPEGFHRSAAEVFRKQAVYKDAAEPPDLDALLARLRAPRD
jgi:3-hydroxyisobutyrate dehydrogenase-like beta-hydroxyacid dehydrogenase